MSFDRSNRRCFRQTLLFLPRYRKHPSQNADYSMEFLRVRHAVFAMTSRHRWQSFMQEKAGICTLDVYAIEKAHYLIVACCRVCWSMRSCVCANFGAEFGNGVNPKRNTNAIIRWRVCISSCIGHGDSIVARLELQLVVRRYSPGDCTGQFIKRRGRRQTVGVCNATGKIEITNCSRWVVCWVEVNNYLSHVKNQ